MKPTGSGTFNPIAAALEKAARHRKFTWCRRSNGFSDMPIWRVVAMGCNMPLFQVLAFVNRLEELGNSAVDRGEVRGSLESFNADEFAAALGMSSEDCARIYAKLEDDKIGWISFDHIASFYTRNPDRDEDAEAVRTRKRRERTRKEIRKQLARLAAKGKIAEADRTLIEVSLKGVSDAELISFQNRLAVAELSTGPAGHVVTARDIVTVTADQTTIFTSAAVDNSGDIAGVESGGSPREVSIEQLDAIAEATAWIDGEGLRTLVETLQVRTQLGQTYIERWRRDLQDEVTLAAIMKGAEGAGYIGARFHTIITDGVKRAVARAMHGPQLHLMPPRPGAKPVPQADGHNVTSAPVDNVKRSAS